MNSERQELERLGNAYASAIRASVHAHFDDDEQEKVVYETEVEKAKNRLLDYLDSYLQAREQKAVHDFVKDFQTVAIPTTDEYANGWNACRKWVRANLNRLAGLEYSETYSKMPYENGTWQAQLNPPTKGEK